jgi:peroxiredoxin Q/BCP
MKNAISLPLLFLAALSIGKNVCATEALVIGAPAPEFELSDQTGQLHSLEDYRDQWVVLYFYPKDETPGCTTEACEFRDNIFEFRKINVQILGVTEGNAAEAYGVKTKMLGMTVAKRQTFLIDPAGNLANGRLF